MKIILKTLLLTAGFMILAGEGLNLYSAKPGDTTFKGTDSSITYTIQFIDSKGVKRTVPVKGYFNDLTVNVDWVIDIA